MARIAEAAEKDIDYRSRMMKYSFAEKKEITTAIAYATCSTAMDLGAAAIITVTLSESTNSRMRTVLPIYVS